MRSIKELFEMKFLIRERRLIFREEIEKWD
jgi:hypothetical protein